MSKPDLDELERRWKAVRMRPNVVDDPARRSVVADIVDAFPWLIAKAREAERRVRELEAPDGGIGVGAWRKCYVREQARAEEAEAMLNRVAERLLQLEDDDITPNGEVDDHHDAVDRIILRAEDAERKLAALVEAVGHVEAVMNDDPNVVCSYGKDTGPSDCAEAHMYNEDSIGVWCYPCLLRRALAAAKGERDCPCCGGLGAHDADCDNPCDECDSTGKVAAKGE